MNTGKELWPGWKTVGLIGHGSFGGVYEIERDVFGHKEKAAVKVISIPQSESDIDELYDSGYDEASITETFKSYLESIVNEYSLMREMNGAANVVNCDDFRVVQHDDNIGWDIFIKMELLTPLTKALDRRPPDAQVIRIAEDMCNALILCKKYGIIHRDIKPQNIFISKNGDYKLGDFGIAKTIEKTSGGTKIGTYKYMAPEVYNNQPYNLTADIYSLGLVLHWMLNERRSPFMPLPPDPAAAIQEEKARVKRFNGTPLPAPAHGSEALKRIVLKACAYDPKDRYRSAEEMRRDLEALGGSSKEFRPQPIQNPEELLRGSPADDGGTIGAFSEGKQGKPEPDPEDNDETVSAFQREKAHSPAKTNSYQKQAAAKSAAKQAEKRAKRRKALWIAVPVLLCVIAISIVGVLAARQSGWIGAAREKETQTEAVPVTSSAAEEIAAAETPDGLQYTIENGSAIILGYTGSAEEIELPSEINGANVTAIGDDAFSGCTELTSITIPEGVTTIGKWAFYNCTALASTTIPDSVTAIGVGAFFNCTALASITIPEGVRTIYDGAFEGCTSLTSVTIPDSVTTIGDCAFCVCMSLKSVTIPDSVTTIGEYAFGGCTSLKSVTIPDSVTTIGNSAFSNCDSLTSVTIPSSVTTIGNSAFFGCTRLTSVTVPSSVTSIGEDAFDEATAVQYEGSSSQQNAATITPTSSQTPSAADLDAIGDSITYPKEASYLSEYKTMYIAIEGNGSIAYVFSKSNGTWAYLIEDLCVYEDNEITVIAEENDHSCIIFYGDDGKQHAGWVNSDYVAEEKIEE